MFKASSLSHSSKGSRSNIDEVVDGLVPEASSSRRSGSEPAVWFGVADEFTLCSYSEACTIPRQTISDTTTRTHPASSLPQKQSGSDPIDPESDRFIVFKASLLASAWPFRRSDRDDLAQHLRIAWLKNRYVYQPHVGSHRSFLKTVIERTATKLWQKALTQARLMSDLASSTNATDRSFPDSIQDLAHLRKRCGRWQPILSAERRSDLSSDVTELVNRLPKPLAELCEALKHESPAEYSRQTGIPQSTVASRITAIRKRFENMNLEKYL